MSTVEPVPSEEGVGLQFTIDGRPVGPWMPPPEGANDLHFRWKLMRDLPMAFRFTRAGIGMGGWFPVWAPVDEMRVVWHGPPEHIEIDRVELLVKGKVRNAIKAPLGTDDLHLDGPVITWASWSKDNRSQAALEIPVPDGANDSHLAPRPKTHDWDYIPPSPWKERYREQQQHELLAAALVKRLVKATAKAFSDAFGRLYGR